MAKPQRKCAKILGKTNMRSKRSIILVGYPPLYRHYMARLSFEKRDIFFWLTINEETGRYAERNTEGELLSPIENYES